MRLSIVIRNGEYNSCTFDRVPASSPRVQAHTAQSLVSTCSRRGDRITIGISTGYGAKRKVGTLPNNFMSHDSAGTIALETELLEEVSKSETLRLEQRAVPDRKNERLSVLRVRVPSWIEYSEWCKVEPISHS